MQNPLAGAIYRCQTLLRKSVVVVRAVCARQCRRLVSICRTGMYAVREQLPQHGTRGWYALLLGIGILCGVAAKVVAWEHLTIGYDDYLIAPHPGTVDMTTVTGTGDNPRPL